MNIAPARHMKNLNILVALWLLAGMSSIACARSPSTAMSVADVLASKSRFDRKIILINGCMVATMHATIVYDCSNLDGPGIFLIIPDKMLAGDAGTAYAEAFSFEAADGKRHVMAKFEGRFVSKNKQLILSKLTGLKIVGP